MASFLFIAKNTGGKLIKGEVIADNEIEAKIKIRTQKLIPVKIQLKKIKGKGGPQIGGGKITNRELKIFTRQFSVLVSSGVPIVQGLEAMAKGAKSPAMIKVLMGVIEEVNKGKKLAEAMEGFPGAFDKMYVNLVKAGEEGGVLDEILNRLAEHLERSGKLAAKIKGALTYPAVIIVVAFAVVAGIMIFVIPSFVEMFTSNGQELPGLTVFVINLSDDFVDYWYFIIGGFVGSIWALVSYYKTENGRKVLDVVFINTPVLGNLIEKAAIARFARTLSTLLAAGVRIIDCLDVASKTTGNWVLERALLMSKESISKGGTIVEPLKNEPHIPEMVTQMISIGEQTGNIDTMLEKIADFFEDEVETAASALTSMIEPLLMVFLGGVIAVIVLAMYMPIFNMAGGSAG